MGWTHRRRALTRRQLLGQLVAGAGAASAAWLLAACQPGAPTGQSPSTVVPTGGTGGAPSAATAVPTQGATAAPAAAATVAPATAGPTAAPAATAQAATPTRGGTMVFAQASDPNPVPGNIDGAQGTVLSGLVYQGLIYVDKDRNIKPQLAESWDASPDQTEFTFHLRGGAKWQDGQDLTSSDVAFTYANVTPNYVPTASATFKNVLQKVETPDPGTVKLTLNKEYGPFLSFLNVPILPEHAYTGTDLSSNPHNRMPIGTGPFQVSSWTPSDSITLDRVDTYWKPGQPYIDRVVIKIVPQGSSRTDALKAGEVDYLPYTEVLPQDFLSVKDDPSFQWATGLTSEAQVYLTLNLDHPPFDNVAFRQALMLGLDRNTMVQQITQGVDKPAISAFHNSIGWAQNPDVNLLTQYPFDPARANQMLDAAGFPRGSDGSRTTPLRFYIEIGRTNFDAISQYVQQQWKDIGVPVQLMPLDRTVMQDMVFVKRDFDINLNESNTGGDPEIGLARFYTCNSIQPIPSTNGAGYCNPQVDALFGQGAAPSDPTARGPYYSQVVKILADDLPYLSLIDRQDYSLADQKFELKSTFWTEGLVYDQISAVYMK